MAICFVFQPAHHLAGVPIPRSAGLTRRNGTPHPSPCQARGWPVAAYSSRERFQTVPCFLFQQRRPNSFNKNVDKKIIFTISLVLSRFLCQQKKWGSCLLFYIFVSKDRIENSFDTGSVTKGSHRSCSSADLYESPFNCISGA